jgi:N-acetyl-anhydromuramyl-L-alanine amidase AmpD
MKVRSDVRSPNFGAERIPVRFAVLHYTACDLATTLRIFADPERQVAAHFVIDTNGDCYDLGGFFDGPIARGAHAGASRLDLDGTCFEGFNAFSIGIELVNLNGNAWAFEEAQYDALAALTRHLAARFPDLRMPGRLVGHEHVAHFRGKCDPGLRFDWTRYLAGAGAVRHALHDFHACDADDVAFVRSEFARATLREAAAPGINLALEERVRRRVAGG